MFTLRRQMAYPTNGISHRHDEESRLLHAEKQLKTKAASPEKSTWPRRKGPQKWCSMDRDKVLG
jgi:hypothetical protein